MTQQEAPSALDALIAELVWDEEDLAALGLQVQHAPFLSIGGGLASFAVVDVLRIAGARAADISVLSNLSTPWERFEALATASQIGRQGRLRSDSSSRIDNVWGWPGYAITEAIAEHSPVPLLRVLGEPLLCEYFTPRLGTVIDGLEREAARIRWERMLISAEARLIRRSRAGGYYVLARCSSQRGNQWVAYRANYVHLGLGYPGISGLQELVELRERHAHYRRVVNAYEPHEDLYTKLLEAPGRVLVRGCGITASRIIERLADDRERQGARTEIVHVFRSEGTRRGGLRRQRVAEDGFSYQAFSFPKAAGGGQLRKRTLALAGDDRLAVIERIGGSTTPRRRRWQRQLRRGRRGGWYRDQRGELLTVNYGRESALTATIRLADGSKRRFPCDYIIDATGFDRDFSRSPLVADLLRLGLADRNQLGGLKVDSRFQIPEGSSGRGRMYASGALTLGCALGPVDSFWGLTQAAWEICEDLAEHKAMAFPGPMRSVVQWWRWMRDQAP
jgi:hypothetical protein